MLCALNEDAVRLHKQSLVEVPDAMNAAGVLALFGFLKKKTNAQIQKFIQICMRLLYKYHTGSGMHDHCLHASDRKI